MNTSVSDQKEYTDFCKEAAYSEEVFKTFKRNPIYTKVLEHTHPIQGQQYYDFIKTFHPRKLNNLYEIKVNDLLGDPATVHYDFGTFSPSSLRYFKIACELEHCFPDIKDMRILEIGGGYGGQAVISQKIHNFKSWNILDLPQAIKLQARYLDELQMPNIFCFPNHYHLTDHYDLVISNYAFSECNRDVQIDYIINYLDHNEKIYMIWNFNFNSLSLEEAKIYLDLSEYPEIPKTGKFNCLVLRGHINEPYS